MNNVGMNNVTPNFKANLRLIGDVNSIASNKGIENLQNIASKIGTQKDSIKIRINPKHEIDNLGKGKLQWRHIIAKTTLGGTSQQEKNIGLKINGQSELVDNPFRLIQRYLLGLKK